MNTEELKHEMYEQLTSIRKARKHPTMLQNFEDDLEAYLEALRQEHSSMAARLDHALRMVEVYSEAFDGQKMRTHNALCESRKLSDDLWQTRRELASVQSDREEGHDKLKEATGKLASQTQTIIALLRVIKDQQTAQASLQGRIAAFITKRNSEQAEAHRQIMQAEAISDERYELLELNQKVVVSQRETIQTLTFELFKARNETIKSSFWQFLTRKKNPAKPLPKKTN